MTLPIDQIKPFLPPGAVPAAPQKDARPPRKGADREKDPRVVRDRALGDYGYKLLDLVYKDYEAQIKVWKNACKDVTAAYATAVDMRAKTFKAVEEKYKADAARFALVFSVVTGGSMAILGSWVQFSIVPSFVTRTAKWDFSKGLGAVPGLKIETAEMFTKMQAAMFGGVVKDAGGKVIPALFTAPERKSSYPMDQPSVAANMDADFGRLVDESAEVVLKQLRDVQAWMNEGTAFGEAWVAYAKGNIERARTEIRQHFDKLRRDWAAEWEFFGKTPAKIGRQFLADQYERTLWADYVHELFDRVMQAMTTNRKYKRRVDEMKKAGMNELEQLEDLQEDWREGFGHHTWIESPIVNRLKDLNVVFAETDKGAREQDDRMKNFAPKPEARVKGGVDTGKEIDDIYGWADMFLTGVRDATARKFFPEAKARNLEPFPVYR